MTGDSGAVVAFEALWTARDVAAYLRVSRSWVYSQHERGLLPGLRFGGVLRFDPEKIRAWVAAESARVIPLMPAKGDDLER